MAPKEGAALETRERVFVIVECHTIEGGWSGDLKAGGLGAWMKLLSYARIFYWNRGGVPLKDLTPGWRERRGITEGDWAAMLKKAEKAGEIAQKDGWLEILNSEWLRSPSSRSDPTKAARMRKLRAKKAKDRVAPRGAPRGANGGDAVARHGAPRGATGGRGAPHIEEEDQLHLKDQKEEEGTGGTEQPEKKKEEEAPAQDTAGPPDTAGGASSKSPAAPARAQPAVTWERLMELTLQNLAFGRRSSDAQRRKFQEACSEACARGATLDMLYRRLRRPRPDAQNVFDCVRQAGLDARGALTAFREFLKVDSLTFAEIKAMAFDTSAQAGIQRQADWNALLDTWGLVLKDAEALVPHEAVAMRKGGA